MITYADIAEKIGVSKAAVSMALRNKPGVSDELKQRIIQTAEAMGYRPNPLVSAHMSYLRGAKNIKYKGKLAFLSSAGDQKATEAHTRDCLYWQGAKETANKLGFDIEVFSLIDPDLPPDRIGRMLWARGIPGIIIGPVSMADSHLKFDVSHFSAVTIGYTLKIPHLHRVRPDPYDMMLTLLSILERRGYKRPGFVQNRAEDNWTLHLWSASYNVWRTLLHRRPLPPPMLLMEEDSKELFLKWYGKYKPDVILSVTHIIPKWLKEEGIQMPQDVGYATLLSLPDKPDFSGLHPDLKAIGSAAVHQLTSQIYNNEIGESKSPRLLLIPPKWHEGRTLRPIDKNVLAELEDLPSGIFTDDFTPGE